MCESNLQDLKMCFDKKKHKKPYDGSRVYMLFLMEIKGNISMTIPFLVEHNAYIQKVR